jgi:hypothetical protein
MTEKACVCSAEIEKTLYLRRINELVTNQKQKLIMKKSIFIVAALAAFTFASCKKDYKCVCTDSSGYVWGEYTVHTTKKKAKDACAANDAQYASVGGSCSID